LAVLRRLANRLALEFDALDAAQVGRAHLEGIHEYIHHCVPYTLALPTYLLSCLQTCPPLVRSEVMEEAEAERMALAGVEAEAEEAAEEAVMEAVMVLEYILVAEYLPTRYLLTTSCSGFLTYLDDLVGDDLGPPPGRREPRPILLL
jgi:hypothetical protein